ncbi:OTU domain-containing protein 6B [Drosophila serrata]|uniref:OTU domain-containing protein 6B n=1 Tax=Drosophila serrata TaxID=7274 RepID=UPI000A1D321F|nr:OTU domain-containing protein 6B [Drosophila serrata]
MGSEDEGIHDLEARLEDVNLEDIGARHRRERKELQAKLQAMKKNAPKNNKNKRKEFLEEMARLEGELEQRHKAELQSGEASAPPAEVKQQVEEKPAKSVHNEEETEEQGEEPDHPPNQRVSKAQKRRDKKAKEAREREAEIKVELQNAANQPSPKLIELQQITAKLSSRQLSLHNIASDGDCLYQSIKHQLIVNALPGHSVLELRQETANYVRAHKDSLICYMTHPETGELLNDEQFEQYCQDIAKTHAWGGHIELKAISSLLKVPIEVIQAEGAPTLLGQEEFGGAPLVICYHRHIYQLGAHYNSTVPVA